MYTCIITRGEYNNGEVLHKSVGIRLRKTLHKSAMPDHITSVMIENHTYVKTARMYTCTITRGECNNGEVLHKSVGIRLRKTLYKSAMPYHIAFPPV